MPDERKIKTKDKLKYVDCYHGHDCKHMRTCGIKLSGLHPASAAGSFCMAFLQVDISQTDSDLKNEHEFYYTLINKGVGPAIIDSCTVILNDTMYQGMSDLISQKLKRKKFKGTFGYVDIYPSRIIAQGEQLNLAGAQGNDIKDSMINLIQDASFRMMIRYHSIYQRQWQLNINYHHSPPLQTIELKD